MKEEQQQEEDRQQNLRKGQQEDLRKALSTALGVLTWHVSPHLG